MDRGHSADLVSRGLARVAIDYQLARSRELTVPEVEIVRRLRGGEPSCTVFDYCTPANLSASL